MNRKTLMMVAAALAVVFCASTALAQIGFMAVGGKAGYVKPEDIDGTFGLGFFVDLGTIVPGVALEGNADYWSKSWDECDELMDCDVESKCSDLSIGGTARYLIPTQSNFMPFVGGGVAVHIVKCEVDYDLPDYYESPFNGSMDGDDSDSETKFGLHGVAGAEMLLGTNVKAGGEFRYTIVEDMNNYGVFFRIGYVLAKI